MRITLCLAVLALLASPVLAQAPLVLGTSVPGTLGPDSRETYSFRADSGSYVYGYVDQLTVDVVVTILGPDGAELGTFDSPARGPESFQIITDSSGRFTLAVTPFERQEGDYEVLLIALQPAAVTSEEIVDQLMTPFSGDSVPGVVVSVLREGEIVFAKAYGMSNLTYGIPLDVNSGMSVASVSKQFTAMAVMLLVGDGKLTLDDDVRLHLPELKDFGTPVTIRNMLNHTTGYRAILNFLGMGGWQSTDAMSADEPFRVIQRQAALQNPPGAEYNYNNTTFMLLAQLVERVSGQSWGDFLEERIFGPLEMTSTTVKTVQGQVIPGSSQGYATRQDGGYRYVTDFASAYGASGVNTTALDITQWMLNYTHHRVGGAAAVEAITTPGITTSGDTLTYGLGLGIGKYRGQRLYSHTGGETAHRTYFSYYPEIQSGLFMSSNNPSFDRNGTWPLPAPAQPAEAAEDTTAAPVAPTPEQLAAFAGRYYSEELETFYTLRVEDERLMAHHRWVDPAAVNHREGDTFSGPGLLSTMEFHRDPVGNIDGFSAANGRTRGVWFERRN
ncbi:MAG: CubicO group peptidase (beta-lactamase class C family) [Thalassolituus oleivorans]|jgi:CubicO group peptidase (beta-lactamase class C family)